MVLSVQEENRILEKYSMISWKIVHRFASGKASAIFDKDDLYQECMIVLLKHKSKCSTKEEMNNIQAMDLVNALTRYVLKAQCVKLDSNRTDSVKRILESMPSTVNIENIRSLAALHSSRNEDDAISMIDLTLFLDTVTPFERDVIDMKLAGHKSKEVAAALGVSGAYITQTLHRIKEKYSRYLQAA